MTQMSDDFVAARYRRLYFSRRDREVEAAAT
jgi:hypothetical protein